MSLVQIELAGGERRLGIVRQDHVLDLTAVAPDVRRVTDLFERARSAGWKMADLAHEILGEKEAPRFEMGMLLEGKKARLRPPVDHADPHRVIVSGTGLTHVGSVEARDRMHQQAESAKTDSAKMLEMGIAGGKPAAGKRGAAPEWFYKGNGAILRGSGDDLEIPAYAPDGGEEPELVGCYVIDSAGIPCRLGFALGNEWSDHVTEKINYLYLAPSKLRTCAVGPELHPRCEFQSIRLRCKVSRGAETIYDSGDLWSGEQHMCHSLANCEDHHFKHPQHRLPGDVHLHFFGTSKLSFGSREWQYQTGDRIEVWSPDMGLPLVNRVRRQSGIGASPIRVELG